MIFTHQQNQLCRSVGPPAYGRQDAGVAPGGAADLFSMQTGNIMLGQNANTKALEIIVPPEIRFTADALFIITGAHYGQITLSSPEKEVAVEHARVHLACAGSTLRFAGRTVGLRTYLCSRPAEELSAGELNATLGRRRGPFTQIASWPDRRGRIRVLKGPEFNLLDNPDAFIEGYWRVSADSNDMGVRLSADVSSVLAGKQDMISCPVADGTVQCPPTGPIILLKNRQTIGGYPRVLNIITADVDLVAQYAPGQSLRFFLVTREAARSIYRQKRDDLAKISMISE